MGEWPTLTLRNAGVELIDCVHKTPTAQEDGYPYVGIPQMKGGWIDFEKARKISSEDFIDWTKKAKPQEHDVVLSRRTNPGVTAIDKTGTAFALGQNLVLLRADGRRVDPPFLKWLVRTPAWWEQIDKFMNVGAVFNSLKCADVPNFELSVPPIETQRRMSALLDAIDDKIDLNRRMSLTLEAMSRAIFKDWFVDFGPTRAKAEGRSPYLAPELWDLFPDALDDEGKPVGWGVATVGDCFQLTMGQSPPGSTYNDEAEGLPFFQGRTDFGFRYPKNRKYCTAPTRIAVCDDTLVSVRAPVGDINMAWEKCCVGRGVAALRHRSGARSFTYYSAWAIQKELQQYEHTGTVFGAINKKQFETLSTVEPTPELVALFESHVGALDDRIRKNVSESLTLAETRDFLLPKLLSGETHLADGEKAMEAMA